MLDHCAIRSFDNYCGVNGMRPALTRAEGNFSPIKCDATEKFRLKGSHDPHPPRIKRKNQNVPITNFSTGQPPALTAGLVPERGRQGAFLRASRARINEGNSADYKSACSQRSPAGQVQDGDSSASEFASEAWCLYPCLHTNTQETELGAAQSRACTPD